MSAASALSGKVVALYFSAHWCPPCRAFTPLLKAAYAEANAAGKKLEVVFVSSDTDAAGQAEYMAAMHGDWLRVAFDDPLRDALKIQYKAFPGREVSKFAGVTRRDGIPCMVLVGPDGGEHAFISAENGDDAITTKGGAAVDDWLQFAWPHSLQTASLETKSVRVHV